MKRPLVKCAALGAYIALGSGLLWHMGKRPADEIVIRQTSEHQVITISDPETARAWEEGRVRIESDHPDATTLLRIVVGNPTRIMGKLEANGRVMVINPHGVIVGPSAEITAGVDSGSVLAPTTLGKRRSPSANEGRGPISGMELIPHGSVYVLADRED